MESLYVFLIRNDVWIYILCVLGLVWYIAELFKAQGKVRRAMFGLERETALRTRNAALLLVLILGSIGGIVFYVNQAIAPTLPASLLRPPTPTPDPLLQVIETETPAPVDPNASPTSPIAATVTLPAVATDNPEGVSDPDATTDPAGVETPGAETPEPGAPGTVTPTPSAPFPTQAAAAGCTPAVMISEPSSGSRVFGRLTVYGSVDTPNFAYYELEMSGPQTNGRWANLLGRPVDQPVVDGILGGNISLSQWEPGAYLIRLKVVNTDDQITHQCVVDVQLTAN